MKKDYELKYDYYLKMHRQQVKQGYEWIKEYVPEILKYAGDMEEQIEHHDDSKFSEEEYGPYARYFYVNEKKDQNEFNEAWNHHQKRNPHHWQYWVCINEDERNKIRTIDMPYNYIIEMICDWWSFSWSKKLLGEMFTWYDRNKYDMIMSTKTRMQLEYALGKIEEKLIEMNLYKLEEKR